MYIKNNAVKIIWRVIFIAACITGLALTFSASHGYSAILLCYYTVLSNLVCLLYFIYLVAFRPKNENALIKGAVTMCITLTGLVYHFLLSGQTMGGDAHLTTQAIGNYFVHYAVPIMVVLDYFLFSKKGRYKWYYPFLWMVIPYLYVIFAFVRAAVGGAIFTGFGPNATNSRYPYPFIDVDLLGAKKVVLAVIVITAAYVALGFIFYGIDKLMGKKKNKNRNETIAVPVTK